MVFFPYEVELLLVTLVLERYIMANLFNKDTASQKLFINCVQDGTRIDDEEKLSKIITDLRRKLKDTSIEITPYIGKDGSPIIELSY